MNALTPVPPEPQCLNSQLDELLVPVGGGQSRFRWLMKSSPAGTAASASLRPDSTRGGRPCCHYAPVGVEPGRYN